MHKKSIQPTLYGACRNYSYLVVAEINFVSIYDREWQFVQTEAREEAAYPEKTAISSGWYYLVGDSLY